MAEERQRKSVELVLPVRMLVLPVGMLVLLMELLCLVGMAVLRAEMLRLLVMFCRLECWSADWSRRLAGRGAIHSVTGERPAGRSCGAAQHGTAKAAAAARRVVGPQRHSDRHRVAGLCRPPRRSGGQADRTTVAWRCDVWRAV